MASSFNIARLYNFARLSFGHFIESQFIYYYRALTTEPRHGGMVTFVRVVGDGGPAHGGLRAWVISKP